MSPSLDLPTDRSARETGHPFSKPGNTEDSNRYEGGQDRLGRALAAQLGRSIRDVTRDSPERQEAREQKAEEAEHLAVEEERRLLESVEAWSLLEGPESEDKEGGSLEKEEEVEGEYGGMEEEDRVGVGALNRVGRSGEEGSAVVRMGLRRRRERAMGSEEVEVGRWEGLSLVTARRVYKGMVVLLKGSLVFLRSFPSPLVSPEALQSSRTGPSSPTHRGAKGAGGGAAEETAEGRGSGTGEVEEEESEGFGRQRWCLGDVCGVMLRRYRLRDTAVEIFLRSGRIRSIFLDFGRMKQDSQRRDNFFYRLHSWVPAAAWRQWPKAAPDYLMRRYKVTEAWQRREISNYAYLMALNTISGRSFNDLSQYPVFPWILSNYTDAHLDLNDPKNYRNLSKSMGALNESRLAEFIERYEAFSDPAIPKFMYGSHYSTAAGVVLHYLVRLQPFADLHKEMQGGAFDVADRLFASIPRAWRMNTSDLSEVKELTPEWYTLPDFLRNTNRMELGHTQAGDPVDDVILPPWAATAEDFIRIQREALESEYVSQNLHHWIDLIFGYKQQGPAAVEARNVFFYLTYYGAVDVGQIDDERLRAATEMQIAFFGQCPMQLYSRHPHPPRFAPCPVIYRPLQCLLRSGIVIPSQACPAEQRGGWELPEPVYHQEADSQLIALRIVGTRIISINIRGVVTTYTWSVSLRPADARDLTTRLPAGSTKAASHTTTTTEAFVEGGPHPLLPSNECLTPTAVYMQDSKLGEWPVAELGEVPSSPPRASTQADPSSPSPPLPPPLSPPEPGSSPERSAGRRRRRKGKEDVGQEGVRPQVLKLMLERDRLPIEHVARLPPPTFPLASTAAVGQTHAHVHGRTHAQRAGGFSTHISTTGRFVFAAGESSGSIQVVELDVETGQVAGEAILMGHQQRVTCLTTAELEAVGFELILTGSEDRTVMLWKLHRLHTKTKKPCILKRPQRVLRGHQAPVLTCALSCALGIATTTSAQELLIHSIEASLLLHRIAMPASLIQRGLCFRHCLLVEDGYIVVCMEQDPACPAVASGPPTGAMRTSPVYAGSRPWETARIQVWTVNGNVLNEVDLSCHSLARLVHLGGDRVGSVLMAARADGQLDFYSLQDLQRVGSYRLEESRLECIDAGPGHTTPVLLACATSDKSLLLIGLPILHHLKDLQEAQSFTSALFASFPVKAIKDTVNLAFNTFDKARGIATTAKGVAIEALGEARTIVRDMRAKGISGVWGEYFGRG